MNTGTTGEDYGDQGQQASWVGGPRAGFVRSVFALLKTKGPLPDGTYFGLHGESLLRVIPSKEFSGGLQIRMIPGETGKIHGVDESAPTRSQFLPIIFSAQVMCIVDGNSLVPIDFPEAENEGYIREMPFGEIFVYNGLDVDPVIFEQCIHINELLGYHDIPHSAYMITREGSGRLYLVTEGKMPSPPVGPTGMRFRT